MPTIKPIEAYPKALKLKDIVIRTGDNMETNINSLLDIYENERSKDSLITTEYTKNTVQKLYETAISIMKGEIDLEPYLPWIKSKSGEKTVLPTNREVLIKDSLLYRPMDGMTKTRYAIQLRLIPIKEIYMLNATVYNNEWFLCIDAYPTDTIIKPIIKNDKFIKSRIDSPKQIPENQLEHAGMYLDNHGAEWIVLKGVKIYSEKYAIVCDPENKEEIDSRLMTKARTTKELLYIRLDRVTNHILYKNIQSLVNSPYLIAMLAQSIESSQIGVINCLYNGNIPKLVKKHGSIPGIMDKPGFEVELTSNFQVNPTLTIRYKYNIIYDPKGETQHNGFF